MNFLGLPFVKYTFIILTAFTIFAAIFLDWDIYIFSMILFGIFEGQGRILMGYNPVFRVLFDVLLLIGVLRVFIKNKKIYSKNNIPNIFIIFFFLHLSWWLLSLFNPLAAGPLASFATAKYYIFPFLLFFAHQQKPIDIKSNQYLTFIIIIMTVLFAECFLCIHQMAGGSEFMKQISPNYTKLFAKFEMFEGYFFRPWGTSHTPGGMSAFLWLSLPLMLMIEPREQIKGIVKRKAFTIFLYLFISVSWFTFFISQVRSAWIKHIIITLMTLILSFLISRTKIKSFFNFLFTLIVFFLIGIAAFNYFPNMSKTLDLTSSISRLENLQRKGVQGQREGFAEVFENLTNRTEIPFGFGPGMCTGYLPQYGARRKQLVDIPSYYFWAMDNFYAFSILELGFGALFYLGSVFSIMFIVLAKILKNYSQRKFNSVRVITPIISFFVAIVIGNWGAIGLSFNPESFYYWLYLSIASSVLFSSKKEKSKDEMNDNEEKELSLV